MHITMQHVLIHLLLLVFLNPATHTPFSDKYMLVT
jgi:hypothetical protein